MTLLIRPSWRGALRVCERIDWYRRLGRCRWLLPCCHTQRRGQGTSMIWRQTILGRPVERSESAVGCVDRMSEQSTMSGCHSELAWCG